MPSIITEYNYDIFISYRQKDNKGDRWVSEFVDALKDELESTFKEEISVYFDINPNDGLLETHDVDESLIEKLKCLVFIPIISRTYCDPKAFAWEHEFKVFVKQASQDQFGLKVKLPGGNVASRVLPIRIHDLDKEDIKLCESIMGGVLRGLNFVHKSPGVNRPLKPSDDPDKNHNKIFYPDQVNKVANAIKDIITCLRFGSEGLSGEQEHSITELQDYNEIVPDSSADYFEEENITGLKTKQSTSIRKRTIVFSLVIFLMGLFGLWGWLRPDSDSFGKLTTYSTIPVESTLMDPWGQYPYFSISPDGRTIATSTEKGIQLRSLSDFSTTVIEETKGATRLAFSPDGQSLVFSTIDQIRKIGVNGTAGTVLYADRSGAGMSWGNDGYIYFSPGFGFEGIWRISANGGEPEQITSIVDSLGECAHTYPQLLPDSKTLLFTALGPSSGSVDSKIVIQHIQSGKREVLIENVMFGQYLSNGNLLYANNDGNLFNRPFDFRKLEFRGEPTIVLSGVNTATASGAAFISVSETGNLIFLPRNSSPLKVLNIVDRLGNSIDKDSIPSTILEKMGHGWGGIEISPAGNQIAADGISYGSSDIWLLDLDTGEPDRITFDPAEDEYAMWSPDGMSIAYTSPTQGNVIQLLIKDLDSDSGPRLIRTWPRHIHFSSWSPDGKWIAAYDYTATNGTDCYAIQVESGEYISIASDKAIEVLGRFSPDGQWLAYQSNESGQYEIYVVSFPDLQSKRQMSGGGGTNPRWDRSGKFIYYISQGFMVAHPVEISNEFKKGIPFKMFLTDAIDFDLSPDGQKFYLVRKNPKRPIPPLYLITNWFQELKTKE